MREVHIDLSSDNYLQQPQVFGGYAGEHKETKLVITLPQRLLVDTISYYYFDFQTVFNEHITSPNIYKSNITDGNKLSILLWKQLLPLDGNLAFCVNAVSVLSDGNIANEGKTVTCNLRISKSPTGSNVLIDSSCTKAELQETIDAALKEAKDSGEFEPSYGEENTSGIMGYMVVDVDVDVKSNSIKSVVVSADTVGYAQDDVVSIVRVNTNCYNCAKIDNISKPNNGHITITLKEFDTDSLEPNARSNINIISADTGGKSRVFVITKPNVGDVSCGENVFVSGNNNVAAQDAASVNGQGNVANTYSHASGRDNFVGYAGEISGRNNKSRGMYGSTSGANNKNDGYASVVGGTGNKVTGDGYSDAVFGSNNKSSHQNTFVAGEGNTTTRNGQTLVGAYNDVSEEDSDVIFAVGNGQRKWNNSTGKYDITRSTALKVTEDGKLHADLARNNFSLIETITLGYDIHGVEPSDWETNWDSYFSKHPNDDYDPYNQSLHCPYEYCHPWGTSELWNGDVEVYSVESPSRSYQRRKTKDNVRYDFDLLLLKIESPKGSSDYATGCYVYFVNEPNDWVDAKNIGYMSNYSSSDGKRYSSVLIENKRGLIFSEITSGGTNVYETRNKGSSYLGIGSYTGRINGWQIANIDSDKALVPGTKIKVYGCRY